MYVNEFIVQLNIHYWKVLFPLACARLLGKRYLFASLEESFRLAVSRDNKFYLGGMYHDAFDC